MQQKVIDISICEDNNENEEKNRSFSNEGKVINYRPYLNN